jgi:ATP-binding cassette, subfamily B, bacterial PglK
MKKEKISKTILFEALRLLSRRDRAKSFMLAGIQVCLNLLDLIGVAAFGLLGALAVNGTASRQPGNRVQKVLEILQIDKLSLQNQAFVIGMLAASLLIIKTILSIFLTRRTMFFLSRRGASVTKQLINKLLSQSLQEVNNRSLQENVYSLTGGVNNITVGIIGSGISILSDLSLLVVMVFALFIVDAVMATCTVIFFGIVAFLLYKTMHNRSQKLGTQQATYSIRSVELIQEVISSYRESIVGGKRPYYIDRISEHQYELAKVNSEIGFLPNVSKYVLEITVVLGTLFISALQFLRTDASHAIAVLSIFLASSTRIAPAILRIQQSSINIKTTSGSCKPTFELIASLSEAKVRNLEIPKFTIDHGDFEPTIKWKNVTFNYDNNIKPAIHNFTLEINRGEIVAIVGSSGAGKTTLVDLVLGVLNPNNGSVLINGTKPLEAIEQHPGAIAYIPQDIQVFNGTIRSNICSGYNPNDIPDDLIWKALDKAQLTEFVYSLPNQLEHYIGDRGSKLSGGQKQRLGIARALITNPQLLVLDEATSALDSKTERDVTNSINSFRGQTTILIIAHRLSSVINADKVIYLDHGNLVKSGTFSEVKKAIPDFNEQAKLMGL